MWQTLAYVSLSLLFAVVQFLLKYESLELF
jgi:hypothetical protein